MTALAHDNDDVLVAALAGLVPEIRPSAEASAVLRERILAQARRTRTQVVRAAEGEWVPFVPGIHIKTLRRDEVEGTQTSLWRLSPGAVVPPHPHIREEECLVLAGSIFHDGVQYFEGDFLLAAVGERHHAFLAPEGALLIIRGELLPSPEQLRGLLAAAAAR